MLYCCLSSLMVQNKTDIYVSCFCLCCQHYYILLGCAVLFLYTFRLQNCQTIVWFSPQAHLIYNCHSGSVRLLYVVCYPRNTCILMCSCITNHHCFFLCFRSCFLSAPCLLIPTQMTLLSLRLLTCTRRIGLSMRRQPAAGPRSMCHGMKWNEAETPYSALLLKCRRLWCCPMKLFLGTYVLPFLVVRVHSPIHLGSSPSPTATYHCRR
jgi:hypothetical protein